MLDTRLQGVSFDSSIEYQVSRIETQYPVSIIDCRMESEEQEEQKKEKLNAVG
jgi:hypothetical protein